MSPDAAHACVVDLDGVVWLAGRPLPGAIEGVAALRERGVPVLFATNNALRTVRELLDQLHALGVHAVPDEVATSAQAAASLLEPGDRVFVVGGAGLREALSAAGVEETDGLPDAVVVGLTPGFDYAACDAAAARIRSGSRFVATNDDATLPSPDGLRPGAGAIVAAIATAASSTPVVAGKPHPAMVRLVQHRGPIGAVIGDRPSTDGAFARALDVTFVHVASDVAEPPPAGCPTVSTLLDAVRTLYP